MLDGKPGFVFTSLKQTIENRDVLPGERLPSVSKLCAKLGVSRTSVYPALDELEARGLIVRKEKSGIYAKGESAPPGATSSRLSSEKPKAVSVADDIESRIREGHYRVGELLPLSKALQYEFNSSARIIREASGLLAQRGLIHQRGATFFVGPGQFPRARGNKTAILASSRIRSANMPGEHTYLDFLKSFEDSMQLNGILLHEDFSGTPEETLLPPSAFSMPNLGALCLSHGRALNRMRESGFAGIRKDLRWTRRKAYKLILLARGDYPEEIISWASEFPDFFPMGIEKLAAGKEIGEYLAFMGHRSLAFFSFSTESWNRYRFEGLEKGHRRMLGQDSVLSRFAADFDKIALRKRVWPQEEKRTKFKETISSAFGNYPFRYSQPVFPIYTTIFRLVIHDSHVEALHPMFERAIKGNATAWICADAVVALTAAEFLSSHKIKVPEKISIICADDNDALLTHRISSYDLQANRMGYLAAHCLLGDIPVKRNRKGLIPWQGKIRERGSVARL